MDREGLGIYGGKEGYKARNSIQGEISSGSKRGKKSRLRLGWIQRQILAYVLQAGLKRFKPSMIPINARRKEVAEAVARLIRHGIVTRVKHGYYELNLDRVKQISLRKPLLPVEFPPVSGKAREFPPVTSLATQQPRQAINSEGQPTKTSGQGQQPSGSRQAEGSAARTSGQGNNSQRPTSSAPAQSGPKAPGPTGPKPAQPRQGRPSGPLSVACNDRLGKHVNCANRVGVVLGDGVLHEVLYDNVRGFTPAGYVHGDKARLLRAEDFVRFDRITYAELSAPAYSDYFEGMGVVKVYFKCVDVNGHGMVCSDFVEWMPPAGFIQQYGIARANYHFRHYVIPAAISVVYRARQVLSRRLPALGQ